MKSWSDYQQGSKDEDLGSEVEGAENHSEAAEQITSLVPYSLEQMLPGVRVSTNALTAYHERQETYATIIHSYSESHARIRAAVRVVSGTTKKTLPTEMNTLPALVNECRDIALQHQADALEAVRVSLGLDKLRDELLQQLRSLLSIDSALALLADWLKRNVGIECATIESLNLIWPHLTLTELSFWTLLRQVPSYPLAFGCRLPEIHEKRLHHALGIEEIDSDRKLQVSQHLWTTVHGLAYTTDRYRGEHDDTGVGEVDPFQVLGITGHRDDSELAEFSLKVRRMVQSLVALTMSNKRLYELLWHDSPEALQVGVGRIARLALQQMLPEGELDQAKHDLELIIATLTPVQRKQFEQQRSMLEQRVVAATIFDGVRDKLLPPHEIVRLVGLLADVPRCLVEEDPFQGSIVPYATRLRFLDRQSRVVDDCPLSPLHTRAAVQTIEAEYSDATRQNRTLSDLFDHLQQTVRAELMQRAAADSSFQLSLIEQAVLNAWIERGVILEALPTHTLREPHNFFRDMWANALKVHSVEFSSTTKMGALETRQYAATLQLLDRSLLEGVDHVCKELVAVRSLKSFSEGMINDGYYDVDQQSVTICEPVQFWYGTSSPPAKAARSFTLVHECGEAIWRTLTDEERATYTNISWPRSKRQRAHRHFLTFYSHHIDSREDFCEHLACYVLHGDEFREAARGARPLRRKYLFLKRVMERFSGRAQEYPSLTPWTIGQIHGALEQEIHQLEVEDAIRAQEEELALESLASLERIFEVRHSFERLAEREERITTAEETDDDSIERHLAEIEEDDEEWETPLANGQGVILISELRREVEEILSTTLDPDEPTFRMLRNDIVECILNHDWEGIAHGLASLADEDQQEILSDLRRLELRIDIK